MVEIKVTRETRYENDKAIAIKISDYNNGQGKRMRQILEEHDITIEEAEEAIESYNVEKNKFTRDFETMTQQRDDLLKEVNEIEQDVEFQKFKLYIEDPEKKDYFNKLNKLNDFKSINEKLENVEKELNELDKWKTQMVEIKERLTNG